MFLEQPTSPPLPPPLSSLAPTPLSTVHVGGRRWVVGGEGGQPAARALVLDAATVAAGANTSLTFALHAEVFSHALLRESASEMPQLALALSRALHAARTVHDAGWSRGWAAIVQPAIGSAHWNGPYASTLQLTMPRRVARYAPRGPELLPLSLPDAIFSCGVAAEQRPPSVLFVHAPRPTLQAVSPAAGPVLGGSVLRITASGVAPMELQCVFGEGVLGVAPATVAIEDALHRGEYFCVSPPAAAVADADANATGSLVHPLGPDAPLLSVPVRLLQPYRLEGIVIESADAGAAAVAIASSHAASGSSPPALQPSEARVVHLLNGVLVQSIW